MLRTKGIPLGRLGCLGCVVVQDGHNTPTNLCTLLSPPDVCDPKTSRSADMTLLDLLRCILELVVSSVLPEACPPLVVLDNSLPLTSTSFRLTPLVVALAALDGANEGALLALPRFLCRTLAAINGSSRCSTSSMARTLPASTATVEMRPSTHFDAFTCDSVV